MSMETSGQVVVMESTSGTLVEDLSVKSLFPAALLISALGKTANCLFVEKNPFGERRFTTSVEARYLESNIWYRFGAVWSLVFTKM